MLVTIYTSIAFVGKLNIPLSRPAKEIIAYYDRRIIAGRGIHIGLAKWITNQMHHNAQYCLIWGFVLFDTHKR